MKNTILLFAMIVLLSGASVAQVLIGQNPTAPVDQSAMVKVDGTTGGFLMPRMTRAQRLGIATPAEGLTVYQTDDKTGYYVYTDPTWSYFTSSSQVHGKVKVDGVSELYTGIVGSGFTATQVGTSSEFVVNFAAPFGSTPNVTISSAPFPPLSPIVNTDPYCSPTHANNCTPSFAADYLDDVVLESCLNGACPGSAADGINDVGTGCNNTPFNYVDNFSIPVLNGTIYGACYPGAPSTFNICMRSSLDWDDELFAMIDWNQDGDFFDPNEIVVEYYNPAPNDLYYCENNITVPADAKSGDTVMRCMSLFAFAVPQPCGAFPWGETQDYKITVAGACGAAAADDRASNCSISAVTNTNFRVICAELSGNAKATSFDFYAVE